MAQVRGHNLARKRRRKIAVSRLFFQDHVPIDKKTVSDRTYNRITDKGSEAIMLDSCQNAQERWGGVHLLIDRWLQERQELVGAYAAISSAPQAPATNAQTLQRFCEILVDYVSAGHFEVYEQLTNEAKAFDDQRGLDLAKQIYPRIEVITEVALAFNDRCDNGDCRDSVSLAEELQHLGRLLHERFELEDCLIEVLHNAHRQQAPASIT